MQLVAPSPLNCRHKKRNRKYEKKVLQTKQNETKQNKRQAAVISNHNNCSERSNKKQTKRERGREEERERDTKEESRC